MSKLYECPDCGTEMVTHTYSLGRSSNYDHIEPTEVEESYIYCETCEKDQTIVVEDRMFEMASDKY